MNDPVVAGGVTRLQAAVRGAQWRSTGYRSRYPGMTRYGRSMRLLRDYQDRHPPIDMPGYIAARFVALARERANHGLAQDLGRLGYIAWRSSQRRGAVQRQRQQMRRSRLSQLQPPVLMPRRQRR